jgi:hypothetical protein
LGSLGTQRATAEVRWTSDQAALIAKRDGYDTSKWENVAAGVAKGVLSDTLAKRWDTTDENGNLQITYFNKVRFLVRQYISPIHTFVNIPALVLKNTLRFLIRAGIFTKV